MMAIPAVDLRQGACVQLVGGDYAEERIRRADPLGVAREWAAAGFRQLHLVDLDAATGRGSNMEILCRIATIPDIAVQAGGGVRDEAAVQRIATAGARRIVVGTRALEEPAWLASLAGQFPSRIVLAVDVRDRFVVTRGWSHTLDRTPLDVIAEVEDLPLAAFLVTAVHREGRLEGPDLDLMTAVAGRSRIPVQASGGIASLEDLRELASCGVAGAVIGMALYTGALDAHAAAEEFPE